MSLMDSLFDAGTTNVFKLCDAVRETSFAIHQYHKQGHLEKIYENALFHRLKKSGFRVEQQFPLQVYDEDSTTLGEYKTDLLVENCLIVEIKACESIADEHIAQLPRLFTFVQNRTRFADKFWREEITNQKIYSLNLKQIFVSFVRFCG
ncbi:MAG: GxxExxY protein [Pyrinomonadaceae bacterium]